MTIDRAAIERAVEVIAMAVEEHHPSRIYVLTSGGKDSTVAAHLATRYGPRVDAIAHVNTGIGVSETTDFVRKYAEWLEIPLVEESAPVAYEDLVLKHGFPGPAAHRYMYIWLKERALRRIRRRAQSKRGEPVMFITGVRLLESQRRMGHVQTVKREDSVTWVAPILEFSTRDIFDYQSEHDLPRNEVVDNLHMSGECLCGAFSRPGELEEIAFFYPDVARRIRRLEAMAHSVGVRSSHWGPQDSGLIKSSPGPLCSGCVYSASPAAI